MFCWRITKYNPVYRNNNGNYLKDEWTDYSDIGKSFEGIRLTETEYAKIENAYINAVLLLMNCSNIDALKIIDLERIDDIKGIKNNALIYKEHISEIIRSILRNKFWCKLESDEFYIHFGYDYYMYIGSNQPCESAIESIKKSGLFVEIFESPYTN